MWDNRTERKEGGELKEVCGYGVLVIILSITGQKIQHVTKSSVKKMLMLPMS